MEGTFRSRKHNGESCATKANRVKATPNGIVKVVCNCGYSKLEGYCDHQVQLSNEGQAFHVHESMPYNSTTHGWQYEYNLDSEGNDVLDDMSFMRPPTYDEIMACDGRGVWMEMGFDPDDPPTLLPVKAVNRARGRPSTKDKKRVSAYDHKKDRPMKAKVSSLGDLFYVERKVCGNCGRYGHESKSCQGGGYIKSVVDTMQAAVYHARKGKQQEPVAEQEQE
jgi:hypothetical protein